MVFQILHPLLLLNEYSCFLFGALQFVFISLGLQKKEKDCAITVVKGLTKSDDIDISKVVERANKSRLEKKNQAKCPVWRRRRTSCRCPHNVQDALRLALPWRSDCPADC